jgi:hypothetical protein
MTTTDTHDEPSEIEALLPWYAAGTLSPEDSQRVEAALAADPLLNAHLARIQEERAETIASAEQLPLPSRRMADRLFAEIAQTPSRREGPVSRLFGAIGARLAGLAAPQLGFSAIAAALVLLVAGGTLGHFVGRSSGGGTYQTASGPSAASGEGTFVLIAFQPQATASKIEAIIQSVKGSIVEGPRAGGLFKLRIGPATMSPEARKAAIDRLTAANTTVKLVIAAP